MVSAEGEDMEVDGHGSHVMRWCTCAGYRAMRLAWGVWHINLEFGRKHFSVYQEHQEVLWGFFLKKKEIKLLVILPKSQFRSITPTQPSNQPATRIWQEELLQWQEEFPWQEDILRTKVAEFFLIERGGFFKFTLYLFECLINIFSRISSIMERFETKYM